MPAGPGASHRSGKDSPPPARTQRDKRTAAASRRRAPRLAHLHCLTIPSSPAGDGLIAPQLSSAHARSRRPPSSPSPALAPPPGSELGGASGKRTLSSEPAPASQETGAEAVRVREAGRAYKCDSEPIPGCYLIRAGLRPPSPETAGPSAAGRRCLRSLPKKLEIETCLSDSVLQL